MSGRADFTSVFQNVSNQTRFCAFNERSENFGSLWKALYGHPVTCNLSFAFCFLRPDNSSVHFSLVAILDPPSSPEGLRDHLAKALEPFRDVESDIETQHECWDCFYHARHKMEKNAREEADGRFGTAVKLADRFKSTGPARPELPTLADSDSDA